MKTISLFLLLASLQCCFGQTDTNILAIGDWSAPVTITNANWPLRGRLLVYDAKEGKGNRWPYGRIYLELQDVQQRGGPPAEFYFDSYKSCLHFEMRDANDVLITPGDTGSWGFVPNPFTIILPPEGTIRVRVDRGNQSSTKLDGLALSTGSGQTWFIRFDSTNDYYLSATFSPPTNRPSTPDNVVWQGTLMLPKVKLPVKKP